MCSRPAGTWSAAAAIPWPTSVSATASSATVATTAPMRLDCPRCRLLLFLFFPRHLSNKHRERTWISELEEPRWSTSTGGFIPSHSSSLPLFHTRSIDSRAEAVAATLPFPQPFFLLLLVQPYRLPTWPALARNGRLSLFHIQPSLVIQNFSRSSCNCTVRARTHIRVLCLRTHMHMATCTARFDLV